MQWKELSVLLRHLSTADRKRAEKAFELGKKVHEGQTRRSGEPYFTHPIAVAKLLTDMEADADTIIAALLHDTVEDTDLTLEEIDRQFNGSVATLIDGVTKLTPEDVADSPTMDDQIETLRKMFTLLEQDVRIMVIKLVDRLHNMQTVGFLKPEKQKNLARETLDVYVKIADRLSMFELRNELEGICLSVLQPYDFRELQELQKENEQKGAEAITLIEKTLHEAATRFPQSTNILYERKTWRRLQAQLQAKGSVVTGLSAVTVVFVTEDIQQCYEMLGTLHQIWPREALSFEDFINQPMLNGYRGLHTTIILQNGTRVRCKIRTEEMHEYARRGIATRCFDNQSHGFTTYLLPWTNHISTLSVDTEQRSTEFYEGLRSDILGESIVVHGADDRQIAIPKDATALDAVFYLYEGDALKAQRIFVDGQEVHFAAPLEYAVSIDATFTDKSSASLQWLDCVQTSFAIAKIREALSLQPEAKRKEAGKTMFQNILTDRKKGFVEEIAPPKLQKAVRSLGYQTANEAYVAIAEGKTDPYELFDELYASPNAKQEGADAQMTEIRCTAALDKPDIAHNILQALQRNDMQFHKLHISYNPFTKLNTAKILVNLPPKAVQKLLADLRAAGVSQLYIKQSIYQKLLFYTGIAVLFFLWGFDPAIAYVLLEQNIHPIDLTIIRFWTLAGVSAVVLAWKIFIHKEQQNPIPLRSPSLWLSALLLFSVPLCTYYALQSTQPLYYTIPMTAAGALLTTIVNRKRWQLLTVTWALIVIGVALIVFNAPNWPIRGIVYTLLAVVAFSLFSVMSERYKRLEFVGARAAQYFFVLTGICAVLSLPLLALSSLSTLSWLQLLQTVLFCIFFIGLPYYIYYYLLSYQQVDYVLRYSFIIIATTLLAQVLFISPGVLMQPFTLAGAAAVILGASLPLFLRRRHS